MKKLITLFWPYILMAIMLAVTIFTVDKARKLLRDKERITNSYLASQSAIKYGLAKDSQPIATTGVMQLTVGEIKELYPLAVKEIDNLKLQLRRVQNMQQVGISTRYHDIIVPLKDSLIKKTVPVYSSQFKQADSTFRNDINVKTFGYNDPYFSINGYIEKDSLRLNNIESRDSIFSVVYKERLKPYLWIFSPTKLTQVIENKNKNSKITYNATIKVIRK